MLTSVLQSAFSHLLFSAKFVAQVGGFSVCNLNLIGFNGHSL